jgi:hypothetical protein
MAAPLTFTVSSQVRARYLDRFACVLAAEDGFGCIDDRLRAVHVATRFQVRRASTSRIAISPRTDATRPTPDTPVTSLSI